MISVRRFGGGVAAIAMLAAMPASAQFFMKSKDLRGVSATGAEASLVPLLADATADEQKAAMVWTMRAALNVAALQCQFEPTLLTVDNYNAMLTDHRAELKQSFDTLEKYFKRVNKAPKAGQMALDQFSTRTYSGFATVAAQYNFCQAASGIGRDVIHTPRGSFAAVAQERMRELRNSLVPWGEQNFSYRVHAVATMPRLDAICWSKKGEWVGKKCGLQNFPAAGIGLAQR